MPQVKSTNQEAKQEEKLEEKAIKAPLVNPFRTLKVRGQKLLDLGCHPVYRASSMAVDEKTHQTYPVFEEFDLAQEVEKCKHLAGMDYMKQLLKTGQAKPEDFYDDGKSGLDTTLFPQTVHEARDKANELNVQIGDLANFVGASEKGITQETLESLVQAKVKEIWEKQQAAQAPKTQGGDNQ